MAGKELFENIQLNYRLDTGEKIKFEELFIDSANIKSILSQSVYISLVRELAQEEILKGDMMDVNMKSKNYGYIEDETFKVLSLYNKNGISDFTFSVRSINFTIKGYKTYFEIVMPDFYSDIAIYNRFKSTKSLYENSNIGNKDLLVFMSSYRGDYSIFEEYSDNMFVDVFFFGYKDYEGNYELPEAEVEKIIADFEKELDGYKKEAGKNPNKAYFYTGTIYISKNKEENKAEVSVDITRYEMSKSFYSSDFKTVLGKAYAYKIEGGGIMTIYLDNKNLKSKQVKMLSKYTYTPPAPPEEEPSTAPDSPTEPSEPVVEE